MPIFKIENARIEKRARFFVHAANAMITSPGSEIADFEISETRAKQTGELYFLLSDAYKEKRHENPESPSEFPKIAALTAISIAGLNPLRPKDASQHPSEMTEYANPILAMQIACDRIGHPFHKRSLFERFRFYDLLRKYSFPTIDRYIVACNGGREIGSSFDINFTREEVREIENKMSLFYVLAGLKIFKE